MPHAMTETAVRRSYVRPHSTASIRSRNMPMALQEEMLMPVIMPYKTRTAEAIGAAAQFRRPSRRSSPKSPMPRSVT